MRLSLLLLLLLSSAVHASEEDLVVNGATVLVAAGRIHDPDAPRVPAALRAAYAEMRAADPATLPVEAGGTMFVAVDQPRGAVIFLHGFAGGYALPCWQVAQAVREAHLAVFCPSVGWRGDWWSGSGERILRATVARARAHGFARLYLAGLSNGAVGAARLAPKMPGVFSGVIAISGAGRNPRPPGVPVLALQGRRDAMSSASLARDYARTAGGDYVELPGGHFAFLLQATQAQRAIADWLRRHQNGDRFTSATPRAD